MSTRAQVRFATREVGVSFNEHPNAIHAQFYVHSDGYPEGLGVEIAECFTNYGKINRWEIECGNLLSVSNNQDKCIFVGEPQKLINKYKQNTNNDG